jgi:ATP-binding cassette subfamily B protein
MIILIAEFVTSYLPNTGVAAVVLMALRNLAGGVFMLVRHVSSFASNAGYATDLRELLEELPNEEPAGRQMPFPHPIKSGIRLEDVTYRYPNSSEDALAGVNLEIRAGEIVALVGANGAGKTTLAQLLVGLRQPTRGAVYVDSVDLRLIDPSETRNKCVAVFQTSLRYPAPLLDNIAMEASTEGPQAAMKAMEAVDLHEVRVGLEEMLAPEFRGEDLSGGQWQKVGIARALFRDGAQLVVFDEPTAAMDPMAELALFDRFASLANGRTTILISHRLGPTRLADRVVVLEAGRVVEEGTPPELIAAGGTYAQMYAAQAGWYK